MTPTTILGSYRPPPGTALYAVGDIHGRADLLDSLQARIVADARRRTASRRVIVYLGDYIDRGPDSKGVIDRLAGEGPPGFERRFLLGNHDRFLLDVLAGDRAALDGWLWNGGAAALASYGLAPEALAGTAADMRERLRRALPPAHLAFFHALQLYHREGDILCVHAGLRPGVALERQTPMDLIWIREEFLDSDRDFGALVVHGHSIRPEPVVRQNRVGVDTGAWKTGTLTAAVLMGDKLGLLQT
jgi:serine/threonine protein phosphatase 1